MPSFSPPPSCSDDGVIHTSLQNGVFEIVIDRPKKRNGFTPSMLFQIAAAFTEFERDEEARCGLLSAAGDHFTAGLQLDSTVSYISENSGLSPLGMVDPVDLRQPFRSKPVVAVVQGICFTIGIELMLAADVVVAADNCRFAQLEVARGIMPAAGATIRMIERTGWGNAMRYLLTGDEFGAADALAFGFVQHVLPADQIFGCGQSIAQKIAAQAPLAIKALRANARLSLTEGPQKAAENLFESHWELMQTEDALEGIRSFVERRKARFVGR